MRNKKSLAIAILLALALAAALGAAMAVYGNGYLGTAVIKSVQRGSIKPGPYEHRFFPVRKIGAGTSQPWEKDPGYNGIPLSERTQKVLEATEAIAYLVIKDGKLVQEHYFRGHGQDKISNSYSMAKPVVGMLLGFAVADGKIASLGEPVGKYLDGYSSGYAAQLRIVDLIRMTSGMAWDDPEVYDDPFAKVTRLYYDNDLARFIGAMPVDVAPGTRFHYNSANTLLAARIVRKAVGKDISEYLSEKLWKPLGMEQDAQWMLDREGGEEKAYCCLSATARDFARLGQFVLQGGAWGGKQVIPREFIQAALKPASPNYGYGLRMDDRHKPAFSMFRGIHGQMVIMVPEYNAVIVKLGGKSLPDDPDTELIRAPETYTLVDEAVRDLKKEENSPGRKGQARL